MGASGRVETGAVTVGQGRPAHLLAVAVVLREGVVLPHLADCALEAVDPVALAAVLIVLARPHAVVVHPVEILTNAQLEADLGMMSS
jgi:hypothetical protein